MMDFCLLTLKAVSNKKQTPLNKQQIEDAINFVLQFGIQKINDPELLDTVKEEAFSEFLETQCKSNIISLDDGLR